jgi:hypothetical protein
MLRVKEMIDEIVQVEVVNGPLGQLPILRLWGV